MKRIVTAFVLLVWAFLPLSLWGQTEKAAPGKKEPPPAPPAAASPAAEPPPGDPPADPAEKKNVQILVKEFEDKRQSLLAAHKAALERLRQARTAEERRLIVAEVRQLQQARLEQQRENVRQMREQMRQTTQNPTRPRS